MTTNRLWIAMQQTLVVILALGAGVAVGLRSFPHFSAWFASTDASLVYLTTILTGVCAAAGVLWGGLRFLPTRLRERSSGTQCRWLLLAWFAGLLTVVVVPVNAPPSWLAPKAGLTLVATGERNPAAKGSEVWLQALRRANGDTIPLHAFALGDGWQIKEDAPVSFERQPTSLRWRGRVEGDLRLTLISHPWSGVAEITWAGETTRVDLYNEKTTHYEMVLPGPEPSESHALMWRSVTAVVDGSAFGALYLFLSVWLATRRRPSVTVPGRWAWVAYAAPCAGVWTFGLLVFWPGLLTFDSIHQWEQATTSYLQDEHPAFHTLLMRVIADVWQNPAAVLLLQVVVGSAICGWGLARLRTFGMPRWLAVVTCLVIAMSPPNVKLMITLWKDVPFSLAFLVVMIMLFQVIATHGRWIKHPGHIVALGLTAAMVTLFRHNGIPAVVMVFFVMFLVSPRRVGYVATAFVLAVSVFFVVRGPVYSALKVENVQKVSEFAQETTRILSFETRAQRIAAHVAGGTRLTDDERALLERVCSLETWEEIYNPTCMTWAAVKPHLDLKAREQYRAELNALLAELDRRNVWVPLMHRYWRTNYVWRMRFPKYRSYETGYAVPQPDGTVLTIVDNALGLEPNPVWPELDHAYARFLHRPADSWRFVVHWRPAVHLWLLFAGCLVAAGATRNWKYVLFFAPIAAHSFFVAWLAPCHCFRYQYPVYLSALLFAGFLLWRAPRDEREPKARDAQDEEASTQEVASREGADSAEGDC